MTPPSKTHLQQFLYNTRDGGSYGGRSDSGEQPQQAHVPVQLRTDLEFGHSVCPPDGVPVDWQRKEKRMEISISISRSLRRREKKATGALKTGAVLVMSTSQMARGAKLGDVKALKLPVSTLVTRFPL